MQLTFKKLKMKIRARAVIVKDGKILLIKRTKPGIVYWVIPGGGVERGEEDRDALIREGKEELGVNIEVKELLMEMDSKKPETKGQKERFYLCEIKSGKIGSGNGPEFERDSVYTGQYDIEWRDIIDLKFINLKPAEIRDLIRNKYN